MTAQTSEAQPIEGVEVLSETECYELLAGGVIGRVAFFEAAGIQLLPVNYRLAGRTIIFRTARGGLLSQLANGQHDVAFEVDQYDTQGLSGWSVVIKGSVGGTRSERATSLDPEYPSPAKAVDGNWQHLQLEPVAVTGRRVTRLP